MHLLATMANCGWLAGSLPEWRRFRTALMQPAATQDRLLRRLLTANASCAYGRRYSFAAIRSYSEFRDNVPIVKYEEVDPWIARIVRGEQSVLTRQRVTRLVPTSGSTNARKLIPFTATLQRQFNAAIAAWMIDLVRRDPRLAFGPAYWSISPRIDTTDVERSAVPIGFDDDSAYLGGWQQRIVAAALAVPSALRFATNIEAFRHLTLLALLRQPELRLISVWHPSFLTILLGALGANWDELVRDVETGTSRYLDAVPPEHRDEFCARPLPWRAAELRRLEPNELERIWPRLLLVSCWGDGQAELALHHLRTQMPHVAVQLKGLLATEAVVSIPFENKRPVTITSHFYEFADDRGEIRRAHELKVGQIYNVIVTTGGGLWRYQLGDLVTVDGFIGATPSLRFLGRAGALADVCGEKLTEAFVSDALARTCTAFDAMPQFALLAPERSRNEQWHYTLFVDDELPAGFVSRLDAELRNNPHYAWCRELGQLGPLSAIHLGPGAYDAFCQATIAAGSSVGDIKPRHLSSRTDWRLRLASSVPSSETSLPRRKGKTRAAD